MKHYSYIGSLFFLCLQVNQTFVMNEKTPLLMHKKQQNIPNNSLNHIQEAITLLKKEKRHHTAYILNEKIKNSKTNEQKKKIIQKMIEDFESEVNKFKNNYVVIDTHGNIAEFQTHQLDPIITLFKKYLRA